MCTNDVYPFVRANGPRWAPKIRRESSAAAVCNHRAAMRAATIRDGAIVDRGAPGPRAPGRRAARPRARGRDQRRRHAAGLRATTRRRPARRPTSRGSSSPARSSRSAATCERFEPGDRVMAVVAGGGQAELAVVHERAAMPVPDELDWTAAGGVPEVFTTAHDALFTQAELTRRRAAADPRRRGRGRHGGAAARRDGRRARHRDGARPGRARAGRRARRPGDRAEGFSDYGPFDVVLELVGAPNLPGDLDALAERGRICVIGVGAGARAELDLRVLMGKRARIHGSVLRARSLEDKAAAARRVEHAVLPGFASGDLVGPRHRDVPARPRGRRRLRPLPGRQQAGQDRARDGPRLSGLHDASGIHRAAERHPVHPTALERPHVPHQLPRRPRRLRRRRARPAPARQGRRPQPARGPRRGRRGGGRRGRRGVARRRAARWPTARSRRPTSPRCCAPRCRA